MPENYFFDQNGDVSNMIARNPLVPGSNLQDPDHQKGRKIKVILEKVRLSPDLFPSGENGVMVRLYSKVVSSNNDGLIERSYFPREGVFNLSEENGYETVINKVIFNQLIEDELYIEIGGLELDTFSTDDQIGRYARIFAGCLDNFVGTYHPSNEAFCIEDGESWKVWYRIEFHN